MKICLGSDHRGYKLKEIIKENRPELEFIELTDAERQAFVDASLPVRDRITEFGGEEAKKVLDLVLADVEKFEK